MILSVSSVPGAVGPKAIAAHRLAVRSVRAPRTMKKSDVKRKKSSTPGFCILPERDGGTCEKRELFFQRGSDPGCQKQEAAAGQIADENRRSSF